MKQYPDSLKYCFPQKVRTNKRTFQENYGVKKRLPVIGESLKTVSNLSLTIIHIETQLWILSIMIGITERVDPKPLNHDILTSTALARVFKTCLSVYTSACLLAVNTIRPFITFFF